MVKYSLIRRPIKLVKPNMKRATLTFIVLFLSTTMFAQMVVRLNVEGSRKLIAGDMRGAMELFKRAIEIDEDYSKSYFNMGLAFYKQGKYAFAEKFFSKALEYEPKDNTARYHRAIVNFKLKKYDTAVKDFDILINEAGANINYLKFRGMTHMKLRNYDQCRADLRAAIAQNAKDPVLHYQLGRSYLYESIYAEAIKHFDKALSIKSDFRDAIAERGIAEVYVGETERACNDFREAMKMGHRSNAVTSLFATHCEK